jgi:hypothetical protein
MQILDRAIKKHPVANISADREKFRAIFEDMRRSAGSFIPAPTWLLCKHPDEIENADLPQIIDTASSDEVFQNEFSALEQRMFGWVGVPAKRIDEEEVLDLVANYRSFLKRVDPLGLWQANLEDASIADSLRVADLGSMMDLNFLFTYSSNPARKITNILEVGGGYGRLAEAAFNVFGKSIRYVLVDSVPASIYYSTEYMKRACPEIRIGSYYEGDPFDLNKFECYVVPSWYFSELNKETYDVCVNIESFQEMNQGHVDSYIKLFDDVSADGAVIYISNSHDYLFNGSWNYPNHWQKVFCSNTPRSWTANHPTEVFVKREGDFSSQNEMLDGTLAYLRMKTQSVAAHHHPTLGDQIELLAGKRARSILRAGKSRLKPMLERLVALRNGQEQKKG